MSVGAIISRVTLRRSGLRGGGRYERGNNRLGIIIIEIFF